MRYRSPDDVADELYEKYDRYNVREIAFYEDNLLFNKEDFFARLDAIEARKLKFSIYAPEGIEPRLLETNLLKRMRAIRCPVTVC
jgi:hypothetical protein